jgi:hypothetical protein
MHLMERRSTERGRVLRVVALAALAFLWATAEPGFRSGAGEAVMQETESFLIDDFSNQSGTSAIGTEWRLFTDRVMGGVSDATSAMETVEGRRCLRLKGRVSLENNGGFIQVALPLSLGGRSFDAGIFKGVRVWVCGNGKTYHIHLRTGKTRLPWQYFSAAFDAGTAWQTVELPFDRFKPENLRARLDTRNLERIALVAIGEEMDADVSVSRLEFYR